MRVKLVNYLFQADHRHRAEHQGQHESWISFFLSWAFNALFYKVNINIYANNPGSGIHTNHPVQLHPSSLDFDKKRFGERCHLYLKGHKVTLWTPAQAMEELSNCCCCGDSEVEEDCGDQEETSFIQVSRAFYSSTFSNIGCHCQH